MNLASVSLIKWVFNQNVPSCPGRKHKSSLGPTTKVLSQPRRNIVGCRIQHVWKEGGGHVIWKGTVLDQVTEEGTPTVS